MTASRQQSPGRRHETDLSHHHRQHHKHKSRSKTAGDDGTIRTHRKGRLSLPSIRISGPGGGGSGDTASSDRREQRAEKEETSTLAQHNQDGRATDGSMRRVSTTSSLQGGATTRGSTSTAARRDTAVLSHDFAARAGPPFTSREAPTTLGLSDFPTVDVADQVPTPPCGSKRAHTPIVPEPLVSEEMMAEIRTSIQNCAEYERSCSTLMHTIEHRIGIWSDLLTRYDEQDRDATSIWTSISAALESLRASQSAIDGGRAITETSRRKLELADQTLTRSEEVVTSSKETIEGLKSFISNQEAVLRQVENLQRGLFGAGTALAGLLAILITWLWTSAEDG